MLLKLRENSAIYPVSLEMVKAHLRLDFDAEDDLLNRLIASASQLVESYLSMTLIEKVWSWTVIPNAVGVVKTKLPMGPLIEVESVVQLFSCGKRAPYRRFKVDMAAPKPIFECSSYVPVEISYRAGMAQLPSSVPAPLIQAILVLIAHQFEQRSGEGDIPSSVLLLLQPYREYYL